MNKQRVILYGLLSIVAAAAAVLSFAALRDLAITCGFSAQLAPLLPVTIDAGAAAGSLAWLGNAAPAAHAYGRALALVLLTASVGGNALGHGLAAYETRPNWLVVVGVSAIAPAVLGALVHLVVLVGRAQEGSAQDEPEAAEDEQVDAPLHSVPSPRAVRDELAEQWKVENPDGGARRLAAYLTEQGHPLSPSGAASAYLKSVS